MNKETGNMAAMREALEEALKTIRGVINSTISPRSNTVFDCRDKLSAALAAPPRNCDRPECATTKAAQYVWRKEDRGKTAYYEWLLATATEKKGGE